MAGKNSGAVKDNTRFVPNGLPLHVLRGATAATHWRRESGREDGGKDKNWIYKYCTKIQGKLREIFILEFLWKLRKSLAFLRQMR